MKRSASLFAAVLGAIVVSLAAVSAGARGKPDAGAADKPLDAGADGSTIDAGDAAEPALDAGAADVDAGVDAGSVIATCIEHVPSNAKRPVVTEDLPRRGLSGYAVELRLTVAHGKGERVLPEGFRLKAGSDEAKELEKAGFVIPDPSGGVVAKVTTSPMSGAGSGAVTIITIPIVALPPKAGRTVLELPPLPIAIARANNEYVTICTKPHAIQIEDPIANELDPKVKPNPPGRQQKEDWGLARTLAWVIPAALALAVAVILLDRWWRRRPKKVVEPPRIPPWVTALQDLERVRRSSLLADGKHGEHFDQVSNIVRSYLGARYGFEMVSEGGGLETTTAEMLDLLGRTRPPIVELARIKEFLDDCDLVKFARFTPTSDHCLDSLMKGEVIVQRTIPVMTLNAPAAAPEAAS